MSRTLNKVMLIGRLGRDPEMRYTASGAAVTTFTLATNRYSKNADGNGQEETEWHAIVTWDKLAETCSQYLTKGRLVYIEGRLQTRSWDGADGQKHYKTEVVAQDMQILDSRQDAPPAAGEAPARREPVAAGAVDDADTLPF